MKSKFHLLPPLLIIIVTESLNVYCLVMNVILQLWRMECDGGAMCVVIVIVHLRLFSLDDYIL